MKILYLGDIVGRSGRTAIINQLAGLRAQVRADFVIVNGENATSGRGLSAAHADALFAAGIDCITLGDHAFDQKNMLEHIKKDKRIIRPINLSDTLPGHGAGIFQTPRGKKILVAQVLGRVFMKQVYDDPFAAVERVLSRYKLAGGVDAIVLDIHCEATSEKMAMGHFCDGRVSFVVGSHTHVPTADAMVLENGTGYLTDAGMCGDYQSVIGMDKGEPLNRFITSKPGGRFVPASGPATLCGVLADIDPKTGLAIRMAAVRFGGALQQNVPQF